MQAYLIQAQADAHHNLHPLQSALTYGSFWTRFVDLGNKVVEFGRVAMLDEVRDLEVQAGATSAEANAIVQSTDTSLRNGYMYGLAYSLYNRDGEWGTTHKAHVWPIEESLFHQAAEANWQIDLLPMSGKINLNAAFRAMKGHVRGEH